MRTGTAKKRAIKLTSEEYAVDIMSAMLLDAFNNLPLYSSADYHRDVSTLRGRIQSEGIAFVTRTLPTLSQGLFDLKEGRHASFPGFRVRNGYPVFLGAAFKHAMHGPREIRAKYVAVIYEIAVAFKKLRGEYKRSELNQQYNDFVAVDTQLGKIDFSDNDPVLVRARFLCRQFAKDIELTSEDFVPRPGPGATNTPRQKYERYEPFVLYQQIDNVLPYADWFYQTPWAVNEQVRDYLLMYNHRVCESHSRFKFVPKTAGKARGICIEENEMQFYQQAFRRGLTKAIGRHPLYKSRIKLHDQGVNQDLALSASSTGLHATIDMSEASDRVSRSLVKYLFQDNEDLCDALMALSTRWIKPPKEAKTKAWLHTNKYAPMGSGLCFPVMSLVHMFLIRAIVQLSGTKYPHWLSTQIFVYGDDIVLPTSCFRSVCDRLPSYGMKINETKSFASSRFRESCGIHAYDGTDVTPVFVRDVPTKKTTEKLVSLIATESQFWSSGWHATSAVLRTWVKRVWPKYRMDYVSNTGIVSFYRPDTTVYDHLTRDVRNGRRVRFNTDLQCYEWRIRAFRAHAIKASMLPVDRALLRWHCERPEDPVVPVDVDFMTTGWSWYPVGDLIGRLASQPGP